MNTIKIAQKPKYLYKPNNYNYYDNDIQDSSDFAVHGDVIVYQPEKNSGDDQNYYNC